VEALKICDQFPDLLVQEVDFTGGEPLLRMDWMEIAGRLNDMGITMGLLTNGQICELDIIPPLKEIGISNVGISLDGLEQTHDFIRGSKGSFIKVLKSISMLQKANLSFIVITTVNAFNIQDLPAMLQMLQSIGVRKWRVQPTIPIGRVKDNRELRTDDSWVAELVYFIRRFKPKAKLGGLDIICGDGLEYIEENSIERPWRGCPAGLTACSITSDGKVIGCLSMTPDLIEGDLRKKDLWSIWFDQSSFGYSRKFSADQLGPNCNSCDMAAECIGGCSSCSYALTGHFHNNPYCFYRNNKLIK
jgi:radical SAM protein with 4Fe4S-binding SPASM domain